jgi:hypothetical protein
MPVAYKWATVAIAGRRAPPAADIVTPATQGVAIHAGISVGTAAVRGTAELAQQLLRGACSATAGRELAAPSALTSRTRAPAAAVTDTGSPIGHQGSNFKLLMDPSSMAIWLHTRFVPNAARRLHQAYVPRLAATNFGHLDPQKTCTGL